MTDIIDWHGKIKETTLYTIVQSDTHVNTMISLRIWIEMDHCKWTCTSLWLWDILAHPWSVISKGFSTAFHLLPMWLVPQPYMHSFVQFNPSIAVYSHGQKKCWSHHGCHWLCHKTALPYTNMSKTDSVWAVLKLVFNQFQLTGTSLDIEWELL